MTLSHAAFNERLDDSHPAVERIADWMSSLGKPVKIQPTKKADNFLDAQRLRDDGDIKILSTGEMIEVKHQTTVWTDEKSYPYSSIIVSNKNSVDKNRGNVVVYIILNKDMTHAAMVPFATSEHWFLKKKKPGNTGVYEMFYLCPLEYVQFVELPVVSGGAYMRQ